MASLKNEIVQPILANQEIYERLYADYKMLYDYFGRGQNDVMKRLKQLKRETRGDAA
jgi:L-ribulokinase